MIRALPQYQHRHLSVLGVYQQVFLLSVDDLYLLINESTQHVLSAVEIQLAADGQAAALPEGAKDHPLHLHGFHSQSCDSKLHEVYA